MTQALHHEARLLLLRSIEDAWDRVIEGKGTKEDEILLTYELGISDHHKRRLVESEQAS